MKIICEREQLQKGVSIVSKAVSSKTSLKILECILIDASGDDIKLTGNDMDLGIRTKILGKIEEPGIIAVEAKLFENIIRKLPD
ncbi:MAG: DNA polymerase III subunit beta, partial [Bacillales bacterium]|nr:DNA polymerase III subunit beta [Bacillales bacterium]